MTENNAAQPPLTDDQIEGLAKKHIAPHADRLDAIMANPVPYQQTEQFRRVKALIVDVLSNLRAPVADEPDWANRRTDSLVGWINEVGTLAQHPRIKDSWLRNAMRTIYDGLSRYGAVAIAPLAGAATGSDRQVLLKAIHRYGNARAMAEHNIAYRDEVRNTVDALVALFDAAPQASAAPAAFPKDGVRSGRSGPDGVFIPASQASADAFPPIDPVQAHVAHCHGCETCDGWHDMLGSQRQASEAVRNAGIAASVDQLVTAAKGMTKLYPHVWDRTDGGLVVFPENVARFDAAFDALRIAVGEAVDDDGTAALSAQPGAQKTGGGDAE